MRKLLIAFFLMGSCVYAKTPMRYAMELEEDLLTDTVEMPKLKKRIDQATDMAFKLAVYHLREKGAHSVADNIEYEWNAYYGKTLFNSRGIGAHDPIWAWLASKYDTIEGVLGKDFCIRSHIAALKTFNFTPPVVLKPCTFEMDGINAPRIEEYRKHFCGGTNVGEPYWGLVPELSYFAVYIGMSAATAGTGFVLVSSLVANVAERLIAMVADDLSDKVFNRFCGGFEIGNGYATVRD